jgi:hypothetical protein
MLLSMLRTRRSALLIALGLGTASIDVEASACTDKCKKKKTKDQQKKCKKNCKKKDGDGTSPPPPPPIVSDRNCDDFANQRDAQTFFISQGGPSKDPHGLDTDHDGIACENLPCPCST